MATMRTVYTGFHDHIPSGSSDGRWLHDSTRTRRRFLHAKVQKALKVTHKAELLRKARAYSKVSQGDVQ
mgnify:CR=1 FL=1